MKISALPLEALLAKLAANFNSNLAAVAATYSVQPYSIEFPATIYSQNTKSFIMGNLPLDVIDKVGVSKITKVSMFVLNSNNRNDEKPRDFSGVIQIGLDFHLAWLSSDLKQNFETLSLATEDAVAQTLQVYNIQNWGSDVVYNGEFSAIRSAIEFPQQSSQGALRQLLSFRFGFQVNT